MGSSAPPRRRPPPPASREDCWTEGETAAVVEAWGERYIAVNRGKLRQKQWQEVADAVNHRRTRPPRTDLQCKNRIDSVKRRYKTERARLAAGGGASDWRFYDYLDSLVGGSAGGSAERRAGKMEMPAGLASQSPSPSPSHLPIALALPFYKHDTQLPASRPRSDATGSRINLGRSSAAAAATKNGDMDEEEESRSLKRLRGESMSVGRSNGFMLLARAVEEFTENYKKVEAEKLRLSEEMEQEWREFAKNLEMQRMRSVANLQARVMKAVVGSELED